jgi:hypothetical protein
MSLFECCGVLLRSEVSSRIHMKSNIGDTTTVVSY